MFERRTLCETAQRPLEANRRNPDIDLPQKESGLSVVGQASSLPTHERQAGSLSYLFLDQFKAILIALASFIRHFQQRTKDGFSDWHG